MHIDDMIRNYLYDQKEYILWFGNQLYIYGVRDIILLTDNMIKLKLINNTLVVKGTNIKIIKSRENEFLLSGDINEISK